MNERDTHTATRKALKIMSIGMLIGAIWIMAIVPWFHVSRDLSDLVKYASVFEDSIASQEAFMEVMDGYLLFHQSAYAISFVYGISYDMSRDAFSALVWTSLIIPFALLGSILLELMFHLCDAKLKFLSITSAMIIGAYSFYVDQTFEDMIELDFRAVIAVALLILSALIWKFYTESEKTDVEQSNRATESMEHKDGNAVFPEQHKTFSPKRIKGPGQKVVFRDLVIVDESKYCLICGMQNKEPWKYCRYCGTKRVFPRDQQS